MANLFKKFLLWAAAILILLTISIIAISVLFQDRISGFALSELKKVTNNQLAYDDAKIDYIKSFPKLSLNLKGPQFIDKQYNQAMHFEELQLKLSIFSSIFSQTTIDKLFIKNGSVSLIERNGKWNVEEFMTTDKRDAKTSFFNINHLLVENFNIIIDKSSTSQKLNLLIDQAEINVSNTPHEVLTILSKGMIELTSIESNGLIQAINFRDNFRLELSYDQSDNDLNISTAKFSNGISINGDYNTESRVKDIIVQVNEFNLNVFNPVMENLDFQRHGLYKFMGRANGDIHLTGEKTVEYNFSLDHVGILLNKGIRESDITGFNGRIKGNNKDLHLSEFTGRIERKNISVNSHINLEQNKINSLQIQGDIPLMTLLTLTSDSTISDVRGSIDFEEFVVMDCHLDSLGDQLLEASQIKAQGTDIKWRYRDRPLMSVIDGDVTVSGGYLHLTDIEMAYQNTDLHLNGAYHIEDGKKHWQLDVQSKDFELDKILSYFQESDDEVSFEFADYNLDININAESVSHKDVKVDDMKIDLTTNPKGHTLNTSGKAFGGEFTSNGILQSNNDNNHYQTKVALSKLDITKFLEQNRNFNQDFISFNNIKGNLTSYGSYDFYWDKQWKHQVNKTKASIYTNVKNGELNNLGMLNTFSKYVNINDLRRVKFTELSNFFEIDGKSIYIPTMFIQSNAANFTLSGLHEIGNRQEYYMQLNAGQILANKFRRHDSSLRPKPAKRNGWFNMYYVITSKDGENYSHRRDRSMVKASFKNGEARKRFIYLSLISSFGKIADLNIPDDWEDQ